MSHLVAEVRLKGVASYEDTCKDTRKDLGMKKAYNDLIATNQESAWLNYTFTGTVCRAEVTFCINHGYLRLDDILQIDPSKHPLPCFSRTYKFQHRENLKTVKAILN